MPPLKAMALCVDEKSQIRVLGGTQPLLSLAPGIPERRPPGLDANGTTTLFAALDIATRRVIGKLHRRYRRSGSLQFLRAIEVNIPADLDVRSVMDNYGARKTPSFQAWFA